MNKNLYNYPTKVVGSLSPLKRREIRLLLCLPDSITNLQKSLEGATGAEKDMLEGRLENNMRMLRDLEERYLND